MDNSKEDRVRKIHLIEESAHKGPISPSDTNYIIGVLSSQLTKDEAHIIDGIMSILVKYNASLAMRMLEKYAATHKVKTIHESIGFVFEDTVETIVSSYPEDFCTWLTHSIIKHHGDFDAYTHFGSCINRFANGKDLYLDMNLVGQLPRTDICYYMYWMLGYVGDFDAKVRSMFRWPLNEDDSWAWDYEAALFNLAFDRPGYFLDLWDALKVDEAPNDTVCKISSRICAEIEKLLETVAELTPIYEFTSNKKLKEYKKLHKCDEETHSLEDLTFYKIFNHIDSPNGRSIMINGSPLNYQTVEWTEVIQRMEKADPLSIEVRNFWYRYTLRKWEDM